MINETIKVIVVGLFGFIASIINKKVEIEQTKTALNEYKNIIESKVIDLENSLVKKIKESNGGRLTIKQGANIKLIAKDEIERIVTKKMKKVLKKTVTDIDSYTGIQIEKILKGLK